MGILFEKTYSSNQQRIKQSGESTQNLQKLNTSNWLDYHNDKWGFELKLPLAWDGYLVSEHILNSSDTQREYTADICLYFERSKGMPACILQISVFTPEQWLVYVQKVGKQIQPLAESETHVFASNEFNPLCAQLDDFQCDRSKEIPEILSTFRLN